MFLLLLTTFASTCLKNSRNLGPTFYLSPARPDADDRIPLRFRLNPSFRSLARARPFRPLPEFSSLSPSVRRRCDSLVQSHRPSFLLAPSRLSVQLSPSLFHLPKNDTNSVSVTSNSALCLIVLLRLWPINQPINFISTSLAICSYLCLFAKITESFWYYTMEINANYFEISKFAPLQPLALSDLNA